MISSPIWLPATMMAGGVQAWRTALQRRVSQSLSLNASGLVRYLYGLPFTLLLLGGYRLVTASDPLPATGPLFVIFCIGGGLAQIIATNLLIMAFRYRNFVVGTAYSKTEAVQGAILSFLLMGERLSPIAWVGIGCGVLGVMLLSTGGKRMGAMDFVRALSQPAALAGIAAGFFFALTGVGIRRATQQVDSSDPVLIALMVLVTTVALQTVMQGGWLLWREPGEIRRVLASWRLSGQVGLLSALGSACWFTGYATAPVALVRIVGQIEMAFTMGFGHFYLKEHIRRSEAIGLTLVVSGVVLALAGSM